MTAQVCWGASPTAVRRPWLASRRSPQQQRPARSAPVAAAHLEKQGVEGRRAVLAALGAAALAPQAAVAAGRPGSSVPVGTVFPAYPGLDGFVQYTPNRTKTPSIRAGVIKPDFYNTILNILSGNFCFPRCDEPWVEALFNSEQEGKAQLWVMELFRLVSKNGATLADCGTPEQVAQKIGAFITGNSDLEEEEILSAESKQFADGKTYYVYEVLAPAAKDPRALVAFTVKGTLAYLFVVSASEKQWQRSEKTLRTILPTLQV